MRWISAVAMCKKFRCHSSLGRPRASARSALALRQLGDGAGTRALIGVVLLQRRLAADVVCAAMEAALRIGSVDVEVVAIEARRLGHRRPPAPVVPIGTGARDVRPAPRLDGYDALLATGGRP